VAQAEVHASNLEIMAKDPADLPNDISQEFLKLQISRKKSFVTFPAASNAGKEG
jgi:hypothetical protein